MQANFHMFNCIFKNCLQTLQLYIMKTNIDIFAFYYYKHYAINNSVFNIIHIKRQRTMSYYNMSAINHSVFNIFHIKRQRTMSMLHYNKSSFKSIRLHNAFISNTTYKFTISIITFFQITKS